MLLTSVPFISTVMSSRVISVSSENFLVWLAPSFGRKAGFSVPAPSSTGTATRRKWTGRTIVFMVERARGLERGQSVSRFGPPEGSLYRDDLPGRLECRIIGTGGVANEPGRAWRP